MDRSQFYALMEGEGKLDYEVYLNTPQILKAQKPMADLCNKDELMFQIVHQVEELWMKLIGYTLLDIDDYLQETNTHRIITLFQRVHQTLNLMISQLHLLETMSPKEYQEIRLQLGNGSGQESPGFRTLLKMPPFLWQSYKTHYLDQKGLSVEKIYHSEYSHCDAYVVAEALTEFDELFQSFRIHHLKLIYRTIGMRAKSLKGRSVELLQKGIQHRFFPELWDIRGDMTDAWGGEYGVKRDNLGKKNKNAHDH
ncbi:tryptophan 2,3-dioxygenase family protein [Endozoicomonas numazuensis]|uniref:Tryptophan 2,3-dioxygenase n=1 Tax=Endozoicomonas numazuensis TaxID=1137799 RepID=A0A081ND56_9GAMM|nr:tryptophan 2,3-dioxygenase family protein [Endozoicomonas numazuensis]KEQ16379.1 tryptophan 2,3-dioxygenase [Endozoicomonas numazuensis]